MAKPIDVRDFLSTSHNNDKETYKSGQTSSIISRPQASILMHLFSCV